MFPILWRFIFCGTRYTAGCAPLVGVSCLLSDLPSMGGVLRFLSLSIFWVAWAPPLSLYWGLILLLLAAFLVPNGLIFFVAFEGSLLPIRLLVLWGGLRPERLAAVAYISVYTLVGGGVHVLGLLACLRAVGSLKWGLREPFVFGGGGWAWYAILLALLVKLPAYGVHFWLPKAHVEAPTGGSMVLAGVMLKLGTYGILRYGRWALATGPTVIFSFLIWGGLLACLAIASQADLKGFAAYRSVVHIRLATAALFTWGSLGAKAAFLVALGHGFSSSALFCVVGVAQERGRSRNAMLLTGLRTLGRGAFLALFAIFFASNGAPPFFPFWGEMGTILAVGLSAGPLAYLVALGAGVICPAAYFMAYFRSVRRRPTVRLSPVPPRRLLILLCHVVTMMLFFVFVGPLVP